MKATVSNEEKLSTRGLRCNEKDFNGAGLYLYSLQIQLLVFDTFYNDLIARKQTLLHEPTAM